VSAAKGTSVYAASVYAVGGDYTPAPNIGYVLKFQAFAPEGQSPSFVLDPLAPVLAIPYRSVAMAPDGPLVLVGVENRIDEAVSPDLWQGAALRRHAVDDDQGDDWQVPASTCVPALADPWMGGLPVPSTQQRVRHRQRQHARALRSVLMALATGASRSGSSDCGGRGFFETRAGGEDGHLGVRKPRRLRAVRTARLRAAPRPGVPHLSCRGTDAALAPPPVRSQLLLFPASPAAAGARTFARPGENMIPWPAELGTGPVRDLVGLFWHTNDNLAAIGLRGAAAGTAVAPGISSVVRTLDLG
jgi:hypothetical protein